ncbi:endo alpha-1,4 polygalactosaminidase [Nocardia pseudobrasiliensis]|uniref:Glycosyl hydrolase family 114 n=1 Tax=Nocardia pseudobrasiliensis TaxID=45979 RepID=A0A370HZK5_9NOCA|nr:endo alpha-1,4 polygalactosaminidase [Nocardia pseudobrasiliensis]RDI63909.1 glycosyl hydrolase family 114 [Nocardia pseudobrasiliensis]
MKIAALPRLAALLAAAFSLVVPANCAAQPNAVVLPPRGAGVDYQIGGPYAPPEGVRIVTRDHKVAPADGLYNICYVNAFQTQPGGEDQWDPDLLLRDADGRPVVDEKWGETLLDIRTVDKQTRIADKVNGWIDECAAERYQAVELDNYDSYDRSKKLLTTDQAQSYIRRLSGHAHDKGLAVAQKNAAELSNNHARNGLDFAVAEQCGDTGECGDYVTAFSDNVIDVEYTDAGLAAACEQVGSRISIVQRDEDVVPAGASGYLRRTC